jgi:excisionase family DNA binding protein
MLRQKIASMNPGKPLMTAREVARHLQISDRKLQLMLKSGDAPPHCKIGRVRRWRPEVVEAWLENREGQTLQKISGREEAT